jgi:cellulose synthase/poly-beta-1,6-N-acetylglucosamine synthase-like glycosyltransferase
MREMAAFVLILPLLVASAILVLELVLGTLPARRASHADCKKSERGSTIVLIPAHNEEAAISPTLGRVIANLPDGHRILVVADNCDDATVQIAHSAGVEVIERRDLERRGKGFALDFGRRHLASEPPDCVVVLDADTVPRGSALASLSIQAIRTNRPVQAAYFMEPTQEATPLARFSAIAFYVKNVVRQLGLARIGAPAILTGSGMAFPWKVFADLPLDTGHVTEDLMLGVRCSLRGTSPIFLPQAVVIGQTSSDGGTNIQRRHWESGFLDTAREYVPALLVAGLRRIDPRLLWLALHLLTPPLLLLLMLDTAALSCLAILAFLTGMTAPLVAQACVTAALVAAVAIATLVHGRHVTFKDLRSIPGYLWWKIRLSLRAIARRERSWIRTSRE